MLLNYIIPRFYGTAIKFVVSVLPQSKFLVECGCWRCLIGDQGHGYVRFSEFVEQMTHQSSSVA